MKRTALFITLLCAFALWGGGCNRCKRSIDIGGIKELSSLATVEYTMTHIVFDDDSNMAGPRKILFEMTATAKAGIDLDAIRDEDVRITETSIEIDLPRPKILFLDIRPDKTEKLFEIIGPLRSPYDAKEKNKLLVKGEQNIAALLASEQSGIVKVAGENAKQFMQNILSDAYEQKKTVTVRIKEK